MNWYVVIVILILSLSLIVLIKMNAYILAYAVSCIFKICASNSEYTKTADLEWCKTLRDNYTVIRDEFLEYQSKNKLKRFRDIDPNQIGTDISDIPWDVTILRVYNKDTPLITHFPKTLELLSNVPDCSIAMFSVLHPGKKLPKHYGPYNGVKRYHLGLIVPENIKECHLNVNDKIYNWEEGKDVLFDDTYLHSVENTSNISRVVLFLDVKRKFDNTFLDSLNDLVLYFAKYNDTVDHIAQNA